MLVFEYCIPGGFFRGFRGWTSLRENNMTAKSVNTVVKLRLNLKSAKIKIHELRKLGDCEKNWYTVLNC